MNDTPETNAARRSSGLRGIACGLGVNPDLSVAQKVIRDAADKIEELERERDEAREVLWEEIEANHKAALVIERMVHEAWEQRDDFKKELEIANYRLKGKRHPDYNGIMADGEVDVKAVTEQRDKAWQKIENQAERITHLEGATNHATGTPLSKAIEQRDRMAEALQKLADCDWVITLPDRMDAVRAIANEALNQTNL
jgi:23S rRNA G2069 N7-methylase RlmK/C1962 C5-methylase RlmI